MMVIIININYLVILICSTVFLLSSFVSSQQKSKNIEDPLEFYEYVLYLNAHYPDYYAKNYYGIIGHYNKLMTAAKTKRNRSHGETSRNNRELKRKGPSVSNDQPSVEKLNSKFSKKWVKQSDHSLITISTTPTLTTASDNTTPPITTLTSNTERESLSMFAVSPNGTSLVNDSRPSKHKIENKFVKRFSRSLNSTVSPEQEAFANASREIVNQDLFRAAIDEATTESIKTGSLDEIFAHLEDRFSNSETNKSEIDSSTVPETSTLPTTTITTDNTTAPTPLTTNNAVTTSVI